MTIKELKEDILGNNLSQVVILNSSKNDYLPLQYARYLANANNLELKLIDTLNDYPANIGDFAINDSFYLCEVEKLSDIDADILENTNLIISAKKIDKSITDTYKDIIIDLPEFEEWQVVNYIQGICPGLLDTQAKKLAKSCAYDLFKIDSELSKLKVFAPAAQTELFNVFVSNGIFSEVVEENIYDLTDAIQNKDLEKIRIILTNIANIDVESTGLITLLSNNFKKLIKVWLAKKPTEASTGLKSNQIWVISRLKRTYNEAQLLKVLKTINEVEYKLKNSELPERLIIDYIITSTLTA